MINNYTRIGTEYYKKIVVPLHSGDSYNALTRWKKSEIITDEGKDFLQEIPKFDGFCLIPSNNNYQQIIGNFYNRYEKIEHQFCEGKFNKTLGFLKHIFGEQLSLGMDYLTILWQKPTHILPILCLVSSDRKTGKTTFLNYVKLIFQNNMTINKNEDFRSKFNSDWANKLVIAVDEVLLDKKEDSERLKNLSTSTTFKMESKGIDKAENPFFGKFILCSNNEENFIRIDESEIRYWVRKIPSLTDDNENPDLLEDLKKELPYFVNHLNNRKITSKRRTRMWFTKEEIYTEALSTLVHGNRSQLDKEIKELILDDFVKFEQDEMKYSLSDLVEKLTKNNIRVSTSKVSEVVKKIFKVESKNGSYPKYHLTINPINNSYFVECTNIKGRYYTFNRKDFFI
ncbi:primase-helicase family protein [Mangrovimonas sp. ST2L15]|uniref:primase-helicase family protein n=1 Tax=Mangrovimonas sp. ST2L15 TaxID=1645916 RepID=UPI0006B5CD45|nr:primase-helicase family protein [Mangrovimonas sp. ST2L15]